MGCIDHFPNTSIVKTSVLLLDMSGFQEVYLKFLQAWTCFIFDMICFREQEAILTSIRRYRSMWRPSHVCKGGSSRSEVPKTSGLSDFLFI